MGEIRLNDISYTGGGGGSNVEANPSGQATNTLVKLGVDDTIYGIDTGTDVEANPTGTATETLTKLGVDGTVYGIDSGTDVEANPSGTPTDELSAIGIDGTVYEIIGFELPEHVTMDETKVRVSGDPTGWTSSENYYDEAISWSVGGRVYTKDNAQPALIAGCQYDGSAFYHTVAVSTIAAGTHYRWENYVNDQDIEFEYKGRTWYYSGGVGSYHELPYVGINDIGHFSTMLDAAKYLIDQADLAGAHFVQMSDPETGTIFAGGGEKEDLSDAPFKVTNDGAVYATEFYKNGVPIGGGGGNVDDVYVNGESVLDANKIAQIKSYKEVTQAEYDALPASKESDNVLYCIKDKATADTTVAPIIYSEEEREVGVWTDGKPLYQRVFELNSTITINSGGQNIKTLITNPPTIETIISAQAVNNAGGTDAIYMDLVNDQYRCYCADQINYVKYVICKYTKTTDQPGSGKYAPSGVPAVHYSENEQVVGTDTDGSTVYEITYIGDMNIPIQTWGGTGIYVSGNLISVDGYITRDGEPIPIGNFGTTVASTWILRDGEIKVQMTEYNTGETYKLKRMTVRYTKTTS